VAFLLFGSAFAQQPQWRILENAPARPSGGRHDDVFFLDEFTGWVCNLTGELWKTEDGGYSWTQQVGQPEAFRSVSFLDHDRGFLGSVFSVNLLFETSDGGDTWTKVEGIPAPRPDGICSLWPVDDQRIYGCGKYSGPPIVIKSEDAGATWESLDLSAYASTLVDCYFVSPDSGFVVGGIGEFQNQTKGIVLSTGDGGDSWQVRWQGSVLEEWGWKIQFTTPDIGYVSLERGTGANRYLKSVDGGVSWSPQPYGSGFNFREQGIGFATPQLGWIGGSATNARETSDGGVTWTLTGWGPQLNRVFMLREDLGFAVGQHVYRYSVDPFPTSTGPPSMPAVVLRQNEPNPFNPTTVIPFYLDEDSRVRIVVYDPRGRHMATLLDELRPFGEHRVVWDGRDELGGQLPSGVYYYRLEAGKFAEVRKMALLK
jgi:photosystem II stability/assembly factor-like uncharacterized protein